MPLEAGSVFVRIAGLFDKKEFDKADKRVDALEARAKNPINFRIGIDSEDITPEMVAARAEADAEASSPVEIPVSIDATTLTQQIMAARQEVHRGMGNANASGGDPFTISLADHDRDLMSRFVEGRAMDRRSGAPSPVRDAQGAAGGASDKDRLTVGHLIGGLLHSPGGFHGLGGFGLGSMIGLGPEHLITALGSMVGVGGGALGGVGLAASGWAGRELVGGGSDALVNHETRQNIEAIYKAQQARNQVYSQYGRNSREGQAATAQYNRGVRTQVGGTAAERGAESRVASQAGGLRSTFRRDSAGAQTESADVDSQALSVAGKFLPMMLDAADRNLKILDKDIRPFFAWLKGPQGVGIFKDLENDFAKNMPTSIHMITQALEFFLEIVDNAAGRSGKLSHELNNFFTAKNSESAKQMNGWMDKLYADMHAFGALVSSVFRLFTGAMHDSAHEGLGLVKSLTDTVDQMDRWERSAKGSKELHGFFEGRKSELDAILSSLKPLLIVFFQFYMDVQKLVPGVTDLFKALTPVLN